ncbi:saccharopine dehydrogenase C-terminal domain-containing protein [Dawidia soli]|uniref:Saccharopine dehydrogenase NADP-binding domain-containing protein n=1 Tax=Dawidia soli TaxID=2782352 RepID=A0AAP2GJS5_9BACT|nr:saccharopine dehydrogenase C-terminal domain-containing protein [Dawidia soli]MBT1689691.1 saccharopine dehydrogenase NADP-binding domain-containing protein [Dawidia soli]
MKTVLILGAGRSSSALISYLLDEASRQGWSVMVGDLSADAAAERLQGYTIGRALRFDAGDEQASRATVAAADVVISLLPAMLHPVIARYCLQEGKHLLTASYVSPEMKALHPEALGKGLLFLNECGLDPGIDHMSAMQVIDRIKAQGGELTSFESFTGGLIAPDTDPENPWRYKFTWNPRNVVMAGQSTARYLHDGQYKYIPYQQLFKRITRVHVPGYGAYEGYANRDSLSYRDTYGLDGVRTLLRGTLRKEGFCGAWDVLVQLGCCDDTYVMHGVEDLTHRTFIDAFLESAAGVSVEEKLMRRFSLAPQGPELTRLRWSGLLDDQPVGLATGTPAQVLEHILTKRWALHPADKDFIVMWHRFRYTLGGVEKVIQASLVATGEDAVRTAMAKTVGLPLAIAATLLLQGKLAARGVLIPISPEFYNPILAELSTLGITLVEEEG